MKLDARIRKQLQSFQLDVAIQADVSSLVLWGASGAGKTMTLNCLAGFMRPDSGRILVGDDLFFDAATKVHVPPQKRRCGYIFQDHALFPHMTVMENLTFAAGVSRQRSKAALKQLVEAFELGEMVNRKPPQLSGGQQQRAALARAMVAQPRMLLLDEPTQGLDSRLKSSFFEILRQTRQQTEALIVLVTHDLDECFEMGDYVCLLSSGKIIQAGDRDTVFAKPVSIEVARSLGIYNVVPAEIETLDPGRNASRLRMLGTTWTGPYFPGHLLGDKGFAVFKDTSAKLARNGSATALQVAAMVPYSRGVRVEMGGGLNALVSEAESRDIRVGADVHVEIPPEAISFLSK